MAPAPECSPGEVLDAAAEAAAQVGVVLTGAALRAARAVWEFLSAVPPLWVTR